VKRIRHDACLAFLLAAVALVGCYIDITGLRLQGPEQINVPRSATILPGQTFAERGGQQLQFDLYRSADRPVPLPLVIMVHGGSWRSGTRTDLIEFAYDVAANGYAAATIDYRLAEDGVVFPAPVSDVLAAVRYFRDNAVTYGIDPQRIAMFGQSAGSHLAMLAGLATDDSVFDPDRPVGESANVKAIVNLFGPTDLTVDPSTATPDQIMRVENLLGKPLDQAVELRREASPILYVRAGGPPVLTIHGDADMLVPVTQARSLVAALNAIGEPSQYMEIPGMDHIPGAIWEGPFAQQYRITIITFLNANL
jgi:acetyl esterase/lipase